MNPEQGKVIIIGAGPGDPELLTIKAARWLKKADVVLVDRLVSPDILKEHVAPDALVIPVGKQCRKGASTPQLTINELMAWHALKGKLVVRLKGGDVSVFSNVLDELKILVEQKIPYEIVPGITAALGAAAYTGIPLTAREHSTAVRLLTYYQSDVLSDEYWKELAQTEDTLVFYMSGETLQAVVQKLLSNGIGKEKLLALVEQATTPYQKITISELEEVKKRFEGYKPASPSLIIIGKVVALHHQFRWMENGNHDEEYFAPVEGRLVSYEEEQNLKLLTA